jgi:hypothetical protein
MAEDIKPKISRVRPKRNKLLAAVQAVEAAEAAAAAPPPPPADTRGDPRGDMRGDPRGLSPREAADARAAEILGHMGDMDEGTDEFFIDPADIPEGWSYEWKRRLLLNKEDPAYEVAVARTGWTAVPAARHPHMMPHNTTSATIERKGMVLMERPQSITERAKAIEAKKASAQVRGKEEQLSAAPQGQFARDNKGNPLAKVARQFEAIPIPAK